MENGSMSLDTVRHPEVEVALLGRDGNAFSILGAVSRALRQAGVDEAELREFHEQATSGDYDDLIVTVLSWVEVV